MGSKHLQTKELQRARFEQEIQDRQKLLQDKGLGEKAVAKDSIVKHHKAKIKQIRTAVARITFLEEQTGRVREISEQGKAAKLAAKAAGKKKAKVEEAPAPKKGQGKAQTKGQAKGAGAQAQPKKKGK
ncbi:MAG: hypothetical protein V2B18_14140 [Pseudomonadota bacterium]